MVTNSKHNLQKHKEGNRTPGKLKKTSLLPQGLGVQEREGLGVVDGAQGRRGLLTEWRQAVGAG